MPSTQIVELSTFGGVDARSNPLALPRGKSLRVQNWCPQPGGYLKQRYGFSTASYFGTLTPSHNVNSSYYFEVDEEATGSTPTVQGIILGYGGSSASSGSVSQLTLGATPTVVQITNHSDGLPFSIYQQDNKIYIPCGDVEPGFNDDEFMVPPNAVDGGGVFTWQSPSNALGTASYATITVTAPQSAGTGILSANEIQFNIPTSATIQGFQFQCNAYIDSFAGTATPALLGRLTVNGNNVGNYQEITGLTTISQTFVFGGSTATFGTSITINQINAGQVGLQIIAIGVGNPGSTVSIGLNSMTMGVYFAQQGSSDTWFTDGFTARRSGIRAPSDSESSSVTAGLTTGTVGDWPPTQFQGYQLYMAYYNPNTGHVGNRMPIGEVQIIPAVSLSLSSVSSVYAGVTVYNGTITGGAANAFQGENFTVQGFTTSGNNGGPFVCVASTSLTLSLQNPNGVIGTGTATATNNSDSGQSVVLSNLPNLSTVNPEWVKLIGRTEDGGEIPYALENSLSGAWVTIPNAQTSATLTIGDVDYTSELPYANGLPPLMHKTAVALGRAYAIDDVNPTLIDYSESNSDLYGSENFVGVPTQSWNPLNQIPSPTGEGFKCIQAVASEIWAFSRNFLSIITELGLYSPDGSPSPYIRLTVPGGCAGQRAFCQRSNSPYWLNSYKQLITRGGGEPNSVSGEYEAGLLSKLVSSDLDSVEVIYHRDPQRFIDRIYICGTAYDPSRVAPQSTTYQAVFVHDFAMGGIGYEYNYNGIFPVLFLRDSTSSYSFRDIQQEFHLLFLNNENSNSPIYQMEEGALDDCGTTVSSDMIGIVNLSAREPKYAGIDISGDPTLVVSHSANLLNSLTALNSLTPDTVVQLDNGDNQCGRFRVDFDQGVEYLTVRLQLNSHPADAGPNGLDLNSPPHIPLEIYGHVFVLRNEMGAVRSVGGQAP